MSRITRLFAGLVAGVAAATLPPPAAASLRSATSATSAISDNVDTGIRRGQCYTSGSDALVDCRGATLPLQDGALGRDTDPATNGGADGVLGLSFARICNNGLQAGTTTAAGSCPADPALGPGPQDWACVLDTLTSIMYEVKTTSGLRSRRNVYTNYSRDYDPLGQFGTATDAQGYIDRVNQAALCGYADWNLNHAGKVITIVDYGQAGAGKARVDPVFFVNTVADWYWSGSPNPSAANTAFAIHLGTGEISNAADRSALRHVIAVRHSFTDTTNRFTISPDGTQVADSIIHARLIWRRCLEGAAWDGSTCAGTPLTFTHEEALAWAAQQAAATGQPWRVPGIKELDALVLRQLPSPPTYLHYFPATPPAPIWTSSPETRQPDRAWAENFDVGRVETHARSERLVLRLARDPGAF